MSIALTVFLALHSATIVDQFFPGIQPIPNSIKMSPRAIPPASVVVDWEHLIKRA